MNKYKEELKQLRSKLPIGIGQAITLLNEQKGNIFLAEQKFKEDTLQSIIEKTKVSKELAQEYLLKYNYDTSKALLGIEQSQFTLAENILKSTKNIDLGLLHLQNVILDEANIKDLEPWIPLSDLQRLPHQRYILLLLIDWLGYVGWEGFTEALNHPYLVMVIQELEQTLDFKEMAKAIEGASKRKQEYKAHYIPDITTLDAHSAFYNSLQRDSIFSAFEEDFYSCKEQLLEKLYKYVLINKDEFPK